MIQLEKLTKILGGSTLFSNASFHIQAGEKCALLGRNGSGKTTLLRMLSGVEEADEGLIRLPKGYRFGWLKQHLHFTQPTLLKEAMQDLSDEKQYLAEKFLEGLGFQKSDFIKSPMAFSGGYQLRLHLCQVLLSEPDGLLLDEPTNYLDLPSIRWMQKFLSTWKGELVIISHDRSFLDSICNTCIGIHRGTIKKLKGSTEEFYQTIFQEEEVYEKTRLNIEKKKAHMEKFIDRFGAKASKASQAQSRAKALEKLNSLDKLVELKSLAFHFPLAPFSGRMMLEANELTFSYSSSQQEIVKDFSLIIEKGEKVAIIGKNGRGKSTLLKLLARECVPSSGHLKSAEAVKIGYFGQTHIDRLNRALTIEEEIKESCPTLSNEEVRFLCGKILFENDLAKKKIEVLSGGEKSRVLLGKILATPSNLLLLDEPTHHLDMESVEALMRALQVFEGSIVLVTHSEQVLQALAPTKMIICHEGKQELFLGNYDRFLETKGWDEEVAPFHTIQSKSKHESRQKEKKQSSTALAREIAKLEAAWLAIEEELELLQQTLAKAGSSSPDELKKLSHLMNIKKEESDKVFEKLTSLSQNLGV